MKDILIVAHFTQAPGEKGNGRFEYIANMLVNSNNSVEIVTTSFSHLAKKHRDNSGSNKEKYKLTMVKEPGYKRNISLKRFYSHYIFGENLKKYLEQRRVPDLIYCAVPSLDAAFVTAQYAQRKRIKFVIDVQDIWPEAFKMVFNVPIISDFIFYPMKKKSNYIYKAADDVIAVSETYVNKVMSVNNKCEHPKSVFLGTELDYFDKLANASQITKARNEIWIAYVGTLGHSYDLTCVIDALAAIKSKGYKNIKFLVMGDGPLKEKFEDYAREKEISCEFMGRLEYSEMVSFLVMCDIAVNPITKGAAGSIINKVGDYAAAALPVINTQESLEYKKLLNDYKAGVNCDSDNSKELVEQILNFCFDDNLRKVIGENNRKLAEEKFDRKKTYKNIIIKILEDNNVH
ncbi:glycosyltransferase family 4 protein [Priestia megaterium]|uniref:glycosyltransferase family 4 protein n=1 Tax=Priestia megaterium TaxID=1404 RepID=UPI002079E6FE|nr:glycosyltransferase family 4 protein [Priestia megaterium]USL25723.1 glycosyltransferase family 4 protein [Priestia megaterium]